jgi:hypothetical protein
MNRSIRKRVGVGAAALALGGFFALVVAPLVAGAGIGNTIRPGTSVSSTLLNTAGLSFMTATKVRVPRVIHTATPPTASCTTARQALDAARVRDKAEDAAELKAGKPSDASEDAAEMAALKPLITAAMNACGSTKPEPSAACVTAMQAVKAAITKEQGEDAAERTAGTEGSAADTSEDQAEKAQLSPLLTAVRTACGFGSFFPSRTSPVRVASTWHWGDRR